MSMIDLALSIILLAGSVQITLTIKYPYLLIVQWPIYLNSTYFTLSIFTHGFKNPETLIYIASMEILSISLVTCYYFSGVLKHVAQNLQEVICKYRAFADLRFSVLAIALLGCFIVFGTEYLSDVRSNYVMMRENSKAGGVSQFFYVLLFSVGSFFSLNFSLTVVLFGCLLISGSKGIAIQPIINFAVYVFVRSGMSSTFYIILFFGLSAVLLIVNFMIQGTGAPIEWFLRQYFDYAENVDKVSTHNLILPNQFWSGSFNEIIPGFNRLFSISRSDYTQYFFPDAFLAGKNPGLLDFENMNRLGIPIFIAFSLVKLIYTLGLYKLVRHTVRRRTGQFILFMCLFLVQNLRIFFVMLVFIYMIQVLRSITPKANRMS